MSFCPYCEETPSSDCVIYGGEPFCRSCFNEYGKELADYETKRENESDTLKRPSPRMTITKYCDGRLIGIRKIDKTQACDHCKLPVDTSRSVIYALHKHSIFHPTCYREYTHVMKMELKPKSKWDKLGDRIRSTIQTITDFIYQT